MIQPQSFSKRPTKDYEVERLMKIILSALKEDTRRQMNGNTQQFTYLTMYMNEEKSWMESRLQPGTRARMRRIMSNMVESVKRTAQN